MGNFYKTMDLLKSVIKFISKQMLSMEDNPGITARLDDIAYSLAGAVTELKRIQKVLNEQQPKEDTIQIKDFTKENNNE